MASHIMSAIIDLTEVPDSPPRHYGDFRLAGGSSSAAIVIDDDGSGDNEDDSLRFSEARRTGARQGGASDDVVFYMERPAPRRLINNGMGDIGTREMLVQSMQAIANASNRAFDQVGFLAPSSTGLPLGDATRYNSRRRSHNRDGHRYNRIAAASVTSNQRNGHTGAFPADPLRGNPPSLDYGRNGLDMSNMQQFGGNSTNNHNHVTTQLIAAVYSSNAPQGHIYAQPRSVHEQGGPSRGRQNIYIEPVAPPPGYSRQTGEDVVAICTSCEEELQDDLDGDKDAKPGAKSKARARSKKEREEHPFWAVATCGHVYCRRCFDQRRNVTKRDKTHAVDFKTDGRQILCAAENCKSDVTSKKTWIGLFV